MFRAKVEPKHLTFFFNFSSPNFGNSQCSPHRCPWCVFQGRRIPNQRDLRYGTPFPPLAALRVTAVVPVLPGRRYRLPGRTPPRPLRPEIIGRTASDHYKRGTLSKPPPRVSDQYRARGALAWRRHEVGPPCPRPPDLTTPASSAGPCVRAVRSACVYHTRPGSRFVWHRSCPARNFDMRPRLRWVAYHRFR